MKAIMVPPAPACSVEAQTQQQRDIENYYQELINGGGLVDMVFPTTINIVLLCDGSFAYIFEDDLTEFTDPLIVLDVIPIIGPDMLIPILLAASGPNQLFALQLDYEKNGNINKATWKTTYHTPKIYQYKYDDLNRITDATYAQLRGTAGEELALDMFSVNNIQYDLLGNITHLERQGVFDICYGEGGGLKGPIDILDYEYAFIPGDEGPEFDPNDPTAPYPGDGSGYFSNQLIAITDGATEADLLQQGFNPNGAAASSNYGYDAAGRMTSDPYKGLTITYNHLDLPATITGPGVSIEITYDATGRKWLQKTNDDYRLYASGLEFTKTDGDFKCEAANTGDGRLIVGLNDGLGNSSETTPSPTNIYPEYHHKDHLGNVRLAFADRNDDQLIELIGNANQIEITQQADYYPFGLQQKGVGLFHGQQEPGNRYRYNGKEFIEEVGLNDYGARWYNPAIGRWNTIEPFADNFPGMSTYGYCHDNPIAFIDSDGEIPIPVVTGLIGAGVGVVSGLYHGESPGKIAAKAVGGFVSGFIAGTGVASIGLAGGASSVWTATAANVVAGGSASGLGGSGATMITMMSGVFGEIIGNPVEQGINLLSGESQSFDKMDYVLSVGISIGTEALGALTGVATDGAKSAVKRGLPKNRAAQRRALKKVRKQVRTQIQKESGGRIKRRDAKRLAKDIADIAVREKSDKLNATIEGTGSAAEVTSSIVVGTASNQVKKDLNEN